ncbi:hypothetical protein QFZ49_006171 [Streptomyces turgidiscabies]|uniref:Uncharacterized protein n=1 Tax=Streptomyces turgidiscabies TaxID=85558 RepID=A0ABU0RW58_9ACTN|nr:hypothetical protein [Streptomyces turgidiscabies]
MHLPQRRPGVGAQLLRQPPPDTGVAVQCLRAAPGGVQRPHQRPGQRLHQRILVEQLGQRTDHGSGITDARPQMGPPHGGVHPLLPPRLPHPPRPLTAQPGERLPAPQTERLAQQCRPLFLRPPRLPGPADQLPEPVYVHLLGESLQQVAARTAHQA